MYRQEAGGERSREISELVSPRGFSELMRERPELLTTEVTVDAPMQECLELQEERSMPAPRRWDPDALNGLGQPGANVLDVDRVLSLLGDLIAEQGGSVD